MTVSEISAYTGLNTKRQKTALDELVTATFLNHDFSGAYIVEKFEEKCRPTDPTGSVRQKRYRDALRNADSNVTGDDEVTRDESRFTPSLEEEVEYIRTHFVRTPGGAKNGVTAAAVMPAWLAEQVDSLYAVKDVELRTLTVDQRGTLARVFAAFCGNVRRDEAKNKAKGYALLAAFGKLSASKHGDMLVRQYLRYGLKTLELRGRRPFHNPFDVEAAIEYKAVAQ